MLRQVRRPALRTFTLSVPVYRVCQSATVDTSTPPPTPHRPHTDPTPTPLLAPVGSRIVQHAGIAVIVRVGTQSAAAAAAAAAGPNAAAAAASAVVRRVGDGRVGVRQQAWGGGVGGRGVRREGRHGRGRGAGGGREKYRRRGVGGARGRLRGRGEGRGREDGEA
jgi:hypothetical protein